MSEVLNLGDFRRFNPPVPHIINERTNTGHSTASEILERILSNIGYKAAINLSMASVCLLCTSVKVCGANYQARRDSISY